MEQLNLAIEDRRDLEEWMQLPDGEWILRWQRVAYVCRVFRWDRFELYRWWRIGQLRGRKGAARDSHLRIDLKSAWALKQKQRAALGMVE